MARFKPRFIFEDELAEYGLPDAKSTNILSLVDAASTQIDEYCGRTDGRGNGSLVYTTYIERLLLQARNRNIVRTSFKPLIAVDATTANELQASGSVSGKSNVYWTGVRANTVVRPDLTLSPLISASGRYGYPRRGEMAIYPDLNYGMNVLQVAAYFGGPPGFTPIDVSAVDFDPDTGELWIPAGLYMSQYTEIVVVYNAGFDPRDLPPAIKQATAMLVRNFLARGGGTTALRSMSGQGMVNVTFTDDLIDSNIQQILDKFKNVIAY